MAGLALGDEGVERAGGLVRVHQIVGAVEEEEVDMVDAELLQRAVDRAAEFLLAEIEVADAVVRPVRREALDAAFGDDLELVAADLG